MKCIRWLLVYRGRRSKQNRKTPEAADQIPNKLRLPNEILLEIISYLELHDEFLLSQTCKVIRMLIQRDWILTLNQLSYIQQLDFWTGLAYVLPNHWVCGPCCRLHKATFRDLPGYQQPRLCQQQDLKFDHFYKLHHSHIQLALKLTRMRYTNQSYLKNIISPFTRQRLGRSSSKLHYFYRASPKVITERFLLQVQHTFRDDTQSVSLKGLPTTSICPHMRILASRTNRPYTNDKVLQALGLKGLMEDVYLAFSRLGHEISGHCTRCPTDYTVVVTPSIITIYTWHDLGSYTSPLHKEWTIHLRSNGNTPSKGPVVYHIPGSIQQMYVKG